MKTNPKYKYYLGKIGGLVYRINTNFSSGLDSQYLSTNEGVWLGANMFSLEEFKSNRFRPLPASVVSIFENAGYRYHLGQERNTTTTLA